jgi:hypothetical protein
VRLAILISLAACGALGGAAWADDSFARVELDSQVGYIIPQSYGEAHKAEFESTIPGPVKIDGFWTPGETSAIVADRVFRLLIHAAIKDPTILFPDLAPVVDPNAPAAAKSTSADNQEELQRQYKELVLIADHYAAYQRQYVGIIVDGQKLVFCNYSMGTKADPSSEYVFTEKFFVEGGKVHFLQCRFDREEKTCSNVSMIGPWQPAAK